MDEVGEDLTSSFHQILRKEDMGYDVDLIAEDTDDCVLFSWNYTSNIRPMLREAGFLIGDLHGVRSDIAAERIIFALAILVESPEKFKALNPNSGHGSYDGILRAMAELLLHCFSFPGSRLRVSV